MSRRKRKRRRDDLTPEQRAKLTPEVRRWIREQSLYVPREGRGAAPDRERGRRIGDLG